jgi:hypothetical protein
MNIKNIFNKIKSFFSVKKTLDYRNKIKHLQTVLNPLTTNKLVVVERNDYHGIYVLKFDVQPGNKYSRFFIEVDLQNKDPKKVCTLVDKRNPFKEFHYYVVDKYSVWNYINTNICLDTTK